MNEDIKRLDRIDEYCDKIIQCNQAIMFHIKDVDKNHFLDNITLQDAVIMRLAVIGERTHSLLKINPEILKEYSDIPWKNIYGMRNIIVHDYFSIDSRTAWNVVEKHLPRLINAIIQIQEDTKEILNGYEEKEGGPTP